MVGKTVKRKSLISPKKFLLPFNMWDLFLDDITWCSHDTRDLRVLNMFDILYIHIVFLICPWRTDILGRKSEEENMWMQWGWSGTCGALFKHPCPNAKCTPIVNSLLTYHLTFWEIFHDFRSESMNLLSLWFTHCCGFTPYYWAPTILQNFGFLAFICLKKECLK